MPRLHNSNGSSARMCLLWKEFFTNPHQWKDNRSTKSTSRSPDFRNEVTCEPLWIEGWHNTSWVHEELERREISSSRQRGQFQYIDDKNIQKRDFTIVTLLKACTKKKDLSEGTILHAELLKHGLLEKNAYVATALITLYAECGKLSKALQVHEDLPIHTIASWSSLISGYSQQSQPYRAWACFEEMQIEGISPDVVTFSSILKACCNMQFLSRGQKIHEEIVRKHLLERNIILGNALVHMYTTCGMLEKAKEVLNELPVRDVVSWSTLIAGYTQEGQCQEALSCFDKMRNEGIPPNAITFTCILKVCGSMGAIEKGQKLHEDIASMGLLKKDVVLGNVLMDMYIRCGMITKAHEILVTHPTSNILLWDTLISGYVQQGQWHAVLNCFGQMQRESIFPSAFTYICILKVCSLIRAIDKGKWIHCEIVTRGFLEKDKMLGTALVNMYAKCGMPTKAQLVFEKLPVQDVVSWSALIAGYVQEGECHEALTCLRQMENYGIVPDVVTFINVLKVCGNMRTINKGKLIHAEVSNKGLLVNNVVLGTALVNMYAKCEMLGKAEQVLEDLSVRNEASWNALISGHAEQGQFRESLLCFERMQKEGLYANAITFTCMLKACGNGGVLEKGKQIHDEIMNRGLLEKDVVVGNALVNMYAKCGFLRKAQEVLVELPIQDAISWNALMTGFIQQGDYLAAVTSYQMMQTKGFAADEVTLVCILKACGITGAIKLGKQIHDEILSRRLLEKDTVLGGALVDMYVKCGELVVAQEVLEELPFRNIVSWSTLIAGYGHQGKGYEALTCFERMKSEGLYPNAVACLCVLNACTHSGLWGEAQQHFASMAAKYSIMPSLEHHNCMTVFLAVTGHLGKATSLVKLMPHCDGSAVWMAVLSACEKWGNTKLAKLAFEQLL